MVENHKRLILSGFIAILIFGGAYITIRFAKTNSVFCKYEDPYLCNFMADMESGYGQKVEGNYIESHQDIQVYQVAWKLSGDDQEMLYKDAVSEQMHVIMVDKKVYLKDYSDGRWWEQPITTMNQYETQLPFEPGVFMGNLKSYFANENNNIYFIKEDVCGSDTCRNYALALQDNDTKKILFFLSEKDKSLKKIIIDTEDMIQELTIQAQDPKIAKPQNDVKIAKSGENIFVENFLQRSQQSRKTPDYVKEFENIRLMEEDSIPTGIPEYVNPTASTTPTL